MNFLQPKRMIALGFCMLVWLSVFSQDHQFRFFPVQDVRLMPQGLLGRSGRNWLLMEQGDPQTLRLLFFDTLTLSGRTKQYPFPNPVTAIYPADTSTVFATLHYYGATPSLQLMELDENGDEKRRKNLLISNLQGNVGHAGNDNGSFQLVYQFIKKTTDSLLMMGVLLNRQWQVEKTISYSVLFNPEQDAGPETFVDNTGNIHILVYDRYNNYRLSTSLSVNTIPVNEENIVSETFSLEKVKLKSMKLFQNRECNCIQAEGMYADGISKQNRGLYSIIFPPGRQNQLAPRFIPFGEDMIRNFRKGFSATDETIRNSLQLYEILHSDSGSVVVLKLQAGMVQMYNSPGSVDPALANLRKNLASSRAGDPLVTTASSTAVTANNPVPRVRSVGTGDRYANAGPMPGLGLDKNSMLYSRSTARNAPKLIFIKLDKEKGIEWYSSKSFDQFSTPEPEYNRQFMTYDGQKQMRLLYYEADVKEEPTPVFATVTNGIVYPQKLGSRELLIGSLRTLNTNSCLAWYRNAATQETGLLLMQKK